MSEMRTNLEIIAPSVEEAIARGASELGLPPEAFDVEVLDKGGRGFLGLGNRQVRVRLTVRPSIDRQAAELRIEETPAHTPEPQEAREDDAEGKTDDWG